MKAAIFAKPVLQWRVPMLWALLALSCASAGAEKATQPQNEDLTQLDLAALMSMDVTVTSVAGTEQGWFQTPAAMYVITAEDARRSGHVFLSEAMRLVPGATVSRINSQWSSIGFRGFDGLLADKLLVMMDGRQIYEPGFGGVFWFAQDMILEDLDRVEAIRGPGATLWGANAVNGVVNVTAKSAKNTQGGYFSALTATDIDGLAEARYGGQLNESTWYRVWGKFVEHDNFDSLEGFNGHDRWNRLQGGVRLDHEAQAGRKLTLEAGITHLPHQEYGQNLTVPGPFPTGGGTSFATFDNRYTSAHLLARLTEEQSDAGWSLQSYFDWIDLTAVDGLGYERHSFDLEWRRHFRWGAQSRREMVWGLRYRADAGEFDDSIDFAFEPASQTHQRIDGFLQDTVQLVPERWFFMIGSKFEYNTHTGFEAQPSARLSWTPDKNTTFWTALSRPVRTPHPVNEDFRLTVARFDFGGGFIVPANIAGSENLDAEKIVTLETGYRRRLSDTLTLDLTAFHSRYRDLITLNQGNLMFENNATATSYGGESVVSWRPSEPLLLEGVYSYFHIDAHEPSLPLHEATPPHQGRLSVKWDATHVMQIDTTAYVYARRPHTRFGSFTRLDLGISWRLASHLAIALRGQNLLDGRHPEDDPLFVDSGVTDIPRAAYARFTVRF